MNQQEFEQTVAQEEKESDFKRTFMDEEWQRQFEKNHKELSEIREKIQCQA